MNRETLQRASRLQQRIDRIIAFQRDLQENPQIIVESRSRASGTSNDEWRNGLVFSKDDELPEFYDLITKFINRQREVLEEQLQKVTEEVMRQLKENLQKLGVKVEPEVKVGDITHWVPIQYLQNKAKISTDAETATKQSTVESDKQKSMTVGEEYFLYKLPVGSSVEIKYYERTVQGVISAFPLKGGNIAIDVWDKEHENYWHLAFPRISTAKLISLPRE